jgi:hypothetical protein
VLKASIEGLEFTPAEREENSDIIQQVDGPDAGSRRQGLRLVKDTFSRNGIPTEQSRAYISMLAAMASVSTDLASATIFDFSFAAAAVKELTAKG